MCGETDTMLICSECLRKERELSKEWNKPKYKILFTFPMDISQEQIDRFVEGYNNNGIVFTNAVAYQINTKTGEVIKLK